MKLSEAIRAGIGNTRQAFDRLFESSDCLDVVAAAMIGSGFPSLRHIHDFREKYHKDLRQVIRCPECVMSGEVEYMLTHLNDDHKKSREEIADLLESRDL